MYCKSRLNSLTLRTATKNWRFAAAITILLIIGSTPTFAQLHTAPRNGPIGSWRTVGSVEAGFQADHKEIIVHGFNDFRRIKFKVTGAPLNLQRLVITYQNGTPEQIEVRHSIPEGGESREIDLPGAGERRVRRIDFWYDTKGFLKGRAHVTVFGMK